LHCKPVYFLEQVQPVLFLGDGPIQLQRQIEQQFSALLYGENPILDIPSESDQMQCGVKLHLKSHGVAEAEWLEHSLLGLMVQGSRQLVCRIYHEFSLLCIYSAQLEKVKAVRNIIGTVTHLRLTIAGTNCWVFNSHRPTQPLVKGEPLPFSFVE